VVCVWWKLENVWKATGGSGADKQVFLGTTPNAE
jgi:hypothetical protein